ncbi:ComF family protein [Mucilaginibacter koreensis]
MKLQRTYLADFLSLLFPQLCQACNTGLLGHEEVLCTQCLFTLPYTDYHQQSANPVAQQFWGRIPLQGGYALLHFSKGGKVQHLIHQLKYQNMPQIGNKLGYLAGEQLLANDIFRTVDYIIPVPLHRSKLRKRGYNQSTRFAEGIAKAMHRNVEDGNLMRTKATETQTHKSRFSRFENMKAVFAVRYPERLAGKHILLVDDVVTTGSTLEACALALLAVPGLSLSIATIAYAE